MADYRNLDIGEVQLGVDSLVMDEEIQALLAKTATWGLYGDAVTALAVDLAAVPEALTTRPFAKELARADERHDGFGTTARLALEAVLADPGTSPEVRKKAQRLLDDVVPTKGELNESYAKEVRSAAETRQCTEQAEDDLCLFPLPNGRDLFAVMLDFVAAKDTIDELLGKRAKAVAAATPDAARNASKLRVKALALMRRLQRALQEEVELKPSLPRNLVATVFGKLDELARLARERA